MNDRYLIHSMLQVVTTINPYYPADLEMDAKPLLKIAEFIYRRMKMTYGTENNAHAIVPVWEQLYTAAYKEPFYSDKSLNTIANNIQEFFQKVSNDKSASISTSKLKSKLSTRIKGRR